MHILGIDPGSRFAGWGIISLEGKKIKYVASGCIDLSRIENFLARTGPLLEGFQEVFKLYHINEVALESLIHVKNVSSLAKLAQARGIILSALFHADLKTPFEYSPNLIKTSVSGNGHADKDSIKKSVNMILGERSYQGADETDALAIAICHALNRTFSLLNQGIKNTTKGRSLSHSLAHKIPLREKT